MSKKAAGKSGKQEGNAPASLAAMVQQLVLPIVVSVQAAKQGLLEFVHQVGLQGSAASASRIRISRFPATRRTSWRTPWHCSPRGTVRPSISSGCGQGQTIGLPRNRELWPEPELLRRRIEVAA